MHDHVRRECALRHQRQRAEPGGGHSEQAGNQQGSTH
jgi:hypothetical protein